MGHLLEEPVFVIIALADGIGNVVGKQAAVAQAPAPQPVIVGITLEELVSGAVGIADLPNLLAVADWLPVEFAEVDLLVCLDGDVCLGVFAQDSVRKGVQSVFTRADVGDGKSSVR